MVGGYKAVAYSKNPPPPPIRVYCAVIPWGVEEKAEIVWVVAGGAGGGKGMQVM